MFQLSKEEADTISRPQIVTMKADDYKRGHNIKYLLYVFAEQGVYKLMTVLKGELAAKQSLALIRAFKSMKDYIIENKNVLSAYALIFVKFSGLNKASISQRSDYGNKSILFAFRQLMNRIQAENICKTDTSVRLRIDTYLYDYNSVNEAIVNSIVHNDWSITEPQISFYSNRIEILSHGGLPFGLTEEEFYLGYSKPRKAQLMKIFNQN